MTEPNTQTKDRYILSKRKGGQVHEGAVVTVAGYPLLRTYCGRTAYVSKDGSSIQTLAEGEDYPEGSDPCLKCLELKLNEEQSRARLEWHNARTATSVTYHDLSYTEMMNKLSDHVNVGDIVVSLELRLRGGVSGGYTLKHVPVSVLEFDGYVKDNGYNSYLSLTYVPAAVVKTLIDDEVNGRTEPNFSPIKLLS